MLFKTFFEVRDNEIDIQGVVNNANYPIYMSHTRHKFLQEELNIDFCQMAKDGKNLFLISSDIKFKKALLPNNKFYVTCKLIPASKIKFAFEQEIRLVEFDVLIAKAFNIGVCMDAKTNRPSIPEEMKKYLNQIQYAS